MQVLKFQNVEFVNVNEHLQTNKPHIFAMGDVNGGPQFTYISLDDYRIVKSYLDGNGVYTRNDRQPSCILCVLTSNLFQSWFK